MFVYLHNAILTAYLLIYESIVRASPAKLFESMNSFPHLLPPEDSPDSIQSQRSEFHTEQN